LGSELRLLGMTFYQNPLSGFKKLCVANCVNGTEDDVLWEQDYEENLSSSDKSVDSD
jgi:hypothetical protein